MAEKTLIIEKLASLAPMAGATDSAFRMLCRQQGAAFCTSEMVSAKALTMGDKKTPLLMDFTGAERPFGIQLFGYDPDVFAQACEILLKTHRPDFIDINMGCPTPKITSNGSGSALMNTPKLAAEIVKAVRAALPGDIPVSAKIRAGYSDNTAAALAPLLEKAGASFITVHGRTRDRMYRPPADLEIIRDVKNSVSVPVIGNGDITSPADALNMIEYTGCDAVAIGRGALGNPFLFAQVNAALMERPVPPMPTLKQRADMLRRHVGLMCGSKGEYIAMREARKHAAWYTKGLRGAAALRARSSELCTFADLDIFIEELYKNAQE